MVVDLPAGSNADSWIVANIQHAGFYRVNYDSENWKLLIAQLLDNNHQEISAVSRAQLLDDALNLGRSELIDQLVFLDISRYLVKESDPLPLTPAFIGINFFSNFLTDDYGAYEAYKVRICIYPKTVYNYLGELFWNKL